MQSSEISCKIRVEDGFIFDRVRRSISTGARLATLPSLADVLSVGLFALTQIVGIEFDAKSPEFYCSATPIDALALAVAAQHVLAFEILEPQHRGL